MKNLLQSQQERFDKEFLLKDTDERAVTFLNQPNIIQDTSELKAFLTLCQKEWVEKVVGEIEGMKELPIKYDGTDVCTHFQENCSCTPSKEKCRKHNQRVAIKNQVLINIILQLKTLLTNTK